VESFSELTTMTGEQVNEAIIAAIVSAVVTGLIQWGIDEVKEHVKRPKPEPVEEEPAKPWIAFS
jgi:hypothetical protein